MTTKQADAPETNLDDTQKGVSNVYEAPSGRKPSTLDAPWGEQPPAGPSGDPDIYGTAVMRSAQDTRANMIERIFDSPTTSAPAEQALMNSLFENARDGRPHSPLLQRGKSITKDHGEDKEAETLTDQVNRVVGFR